MSGPWFWQTPIRYLRWAAHEKPALFYSTVIGISGPLTLLVVPPLRRRYGDENAARIPMTYPIPPGPRQIPQGYDDPPAEESRES